MQAGENALDKDLTLGVGVFYKSNGVTMQQKLHILTVQWFYDLQLDCMF